MLGAGRSAPPAAADPAERGASFMVGGSASKPRGIQSEVRSLFDEAIEPADDGIEDAGEMPTMLGTLSMDDMAAVRLASPKLESPTPSVAPLVAPAAPVRSSQNIPVVSRSMEIAVAAAKGPSGPVVTRTPPAGRDPAEPPAPIPAPIAPIAPIPLVNVTPRSETTVLTPEAEAAAAPSSRSDLWGLLFFIAGLGALVGAVIYAVSLLSHSREPTMALKINSSPRGAAIILDGTDIGAMTPQTLPSVLSEQPHTIELRLEGYEPCIKKIEPAVTAGDVPVECVLSKLKP